MRLGTTEILLLLVLALVLFGGGKLAGVGKALGQSIKEFKKEVKEEEPPASAVDSAETQRIKKRKKRRSSPGLPLRTARKRKKSNAQAGARDGGVRRLLL